jgi:hypothetical protein
MSKHQMLRAFIVICAGGVFAFLALVAVCSLFQ